MTKIAYIGDKPSKLWRSPITQKVYNFIKRGGAFCPCCDVDDLDVENAMSHPNTFDLYGHIKDDTDYFKKLAKRRAAKKAERVKAEKERIQSEKSAEVGNLENIVNEMLEPLNAAINNLSHDMKALKDSNALLVTGLAALQKK